MKECCKYLRREWDGMNLIFICPICGFRLDYGRIVMYNGLKEK